MGTDQARGTVQAVAGPHDRGAAGLHIGLRLTDPPHSGPYVSPLRYDDALTDQVSVFGEQDDGREDADQLQDADVAEILLGEPVSGCRHGQPIHVYDVQQRHVLLPPQPLRRSEIEGAALALEIGQHPMDLRPHVVPDEAAQRAVPHPIEDRRRPAAEHRRGDVRGEHRRIEDPEPEADTGRRVGRA
ncbi:hypothetical protein OOK36_45775 [Streptomyces sp. NBC_00365]|uniref:hypothetical protein n=1 Tax=Streptomyces sp. NBC_00365 TaxID=2975726 RepID=UPI0022569CF2|nr:hypothetical protein [Streptomyces sp. NBC_00365]MCX5095985.1 hypothetical protein [Streptomyces sp. NBC_00365]